jgi:hypothetical protein
LNPPPELPNEPGAGPNPGLAPNVPVVADGPAPCAKHAGEAAINAAATMCTMDFGFSMNVSLQ